ncbi:hypothetical protein D0862_09119 [Hortaea werneckii]|uniref:Uncharacterized protein n=1 Tax=Hortaea werneckii TaxID=91943 RepID=A0A3M7FYC2_HORWE|nr:hypothetical protein D0862_09119 [Hortaea werneckii]
MQSSSYFIVTSTLQLALKASDLLILSINSSDTSGITPPSKYPRSKLGHILSELCTRQIGRNIGLYCSLYTLLWILFIQEGCLHRRRQAIVASLSLVGTGSLRLGAKVLKQRGAYSR